MNTTEIWDVVVVGGGPAGMMASGTAAERDASVILLEKNDTLGKKLLITGGGRCNVTNSEFNTRTFLEKFKDNGKFLFSTFSQWGVQETLDFFHTRGMETKVENELRTFPVSNKAQSVWNILVDFIQKQNVTVRSNSAVSELVYKDGVITGVRLKGGEVVYGKNIIIATGGTSRPETGSTGDGYIWLESIGHTVIRPAPSLVPIVLKDTWAKKLAGTTLSDIKITVLQNSEKQLVAKGRFLFTHVGVSGPTILNMSKDIGELLKYGNVTLSLDLLPSLDHGMLNNALQHLFIDQAKKKIQNALKEITPSALIPTILHNSNIINDTRCSSITREQRLKLIESIKNIHLHVDKLLGSEKAIITSGGVALNEVDFKTMQSKLFPNLYLIGDILNIDRPSGGYSLQLCWTTGYVAGISSAKKSVNPTA